MFLRGAAWGQCGALWERDAGDGSAGWGVPRQGLGAGAQGENGGNCMCKCPEAGRRGRGKKEVCESPEDRPQETARRGPGDPGGGQGGGVLSRAGSRWKDPSPRVLVQAWRRGDESVGVQWGVLPGPR